MVMIIKILDVKSKGKHKELETIIQNIIIFYYRYWYQKIDLIQHDLESPAMPHPQPHTDTNKMF